MIPVLQSMKVLSCGKCSYMATPSALYMQKISTCPQCHTSDISYFTERKVFVTPKEKNYGITPKG